MRKFTVQFCDLRDDLASILKAVNEGSIVEITKRGHGVVARLVPPQEEQTAQPWEARTLPAPKPAKPSKPVLRLVVGGKGKS